MFTQNKEEVISFSQCQNLLTLANRKPLEIISANINC